MVVRIRNETHWRKDDLRRYVLAAIRHEGLDTDDPWLVRIVYNRKSTNAVDGWAYLDSRHLCLKLPRRICERELYDTGETFWAYRKKSEGAYWVGGATSRDQVPADAFDVVEKPYRRTRNRWVDVDELPVGVRRDVVRVLIHELGHCKGLRHRDMIPVPEIPTAWFDVGGTPIRKRESAKPKPRAAAARDDLAHAERKLAEAEARVARREAELKRSRTIRTKWRAEVRRAKRRVTRLTGAPQPSDAR